MGATMAVVSGVATLASVSQQRKAFQLQAAQFEEQKEMSKLQTGADVIAREQSLFYQLATLSASTAARGGVVSQTEGTQGAFVRGEKKLAANDIRNIKLMGFTQQRNFGLSAAQARASGKSALMSGLASATGTIAGTAMKAPPGKAGYKPGTIGAFGQQLKNEWS